MVTGATGYVAGWLVKMLLEEGLTVHACVRDPDDRQKRQYLDQLAAKAPGKIRYFKADLMLPGSYQAGMAGCQVVFHTASPFKLDVKDAQKELIGPALLGTRNVLQSVDQTLSVKRVVLTSSCAAIYGDNADLEFTPGRTFTEAIWNTSSSLRHQPYSFSKTLAEKAAWAMASAQKRWDLVTINPSLVIGSGINPDASSESFKIVTHMGDGTLKAGVPDIGIGAVDVRDVADAHFRAAFTPDASGRYIVSGHNTSLAAMASTLLAQYGNDFPIPRRMLPKWLVWLVGPMTNKSLTRKMVSRNVNLPWIADNRRSRDELGVQYTPLGESMNDFFKQLVESGRFAK